MNVRKKQKIMSIISVIIFVLAIVMFVWYEFGGGRSTLNYDEIVVLKQPVKQGELIKGENVSFEKREKDTVQESYIFEKENIEGLAAKHYIPANTPLVKEYFDEPDLVLEEGEYIAEIPSSWITSVPKSLRRGDKIVLYATQIETDTQKSKTVTTNDEGKMVVVEEPIKNNQSKQPVKLLETSVAFVKDSSNTEVVTISNEDRKDANSTIASVEIITTTEDFNKIENQMNNGSYLIIMYTDRDIIATSLDDAVGDDANSKREGE